MSCEKKLRLSLPVGSQSRKTGNERELVLVQVEKNGIPVYFVAALSEMIFGGTDAILLEKGY